VDRIVIPKEATGREVQSIPVERFKENK